MIVLDFLFVAKKTVPIPPMMQIKATLIEIPTSEKAESGSKKKLN